MRERPVNPAIVEANRGDDFGQSYLKENAAGSGPFMQGRWEIGNLYEFIAVEDYFDANIDDSAHAPIHRRTLRLLRS